MKAKMQWAVLPILRGPLKGKRWLVATRSNFFFGTYEPAQTRLFERYVKPGAVVYDIGAHYGYYSLLSSTLAGEPGVVIAFEPSPDNLSRLRRHIELNRCTNVRVIELAVSDSEGIAHFETRAGSGVGHLADDGPLEVRTTRLDTLAEELPQPDVIKIDVEGAELGVLRGAAATLASARPVIFLSVHSEELKSQCTEFLAKLDYTLTQVEPMELLAVPKQARQR
jgi:FkbM family methyltransferase